MGQRFCLLIAASVALMFAPSAYAQRVADYTRTITIDTQALMVTATEIREVAKQARQTDSPQKPSPQTKLSKGDVRRLATTFGLLTEMRTNPHLGFLDGDIAYWEEQNRSEDRLTLEFAARRIILDAADKQRLVIGDQGKLSWAAQQIMADLLKERGSAPAK